jgi:hypothetical protein
MRKGLIDSMGVEQEIGEIKQTLKILDERVGEITRSIRAYVDFLTEKRVEEELAPFQERIGRQLAGLESRLVSLTKRVEEEKR